MAFDSTKSTRGGKVTMAGKILFVHGHGQRYPQKIVIGCIAFMIMVAIVCSLFILGNKAPENHFDPRADLEKYRKQPKNKIEVFNYSQENVPEGFLSPFHHTPYNGIDFTPTSLMLINNENDPSHKATDYVFSDLTLFSPHRSKAKSIAKSLMNDDVRAIDSLFQDVELLNVLDTVKLASLILHFRLDRCLLKLRDVSMIKDDNEIKINQNILRMSILKASISAQKYRKILYGGVGATEYRKEVMVDVEKKFNQLVNWAVGKGCLEKLVEFVFLETQKFPQMMEMIEKNALNWSKAPINQGKENLFDLFEPVFNEKNKNAVKAKPSILKEPITFQNKFGAAFSSYKDDPRKFVIYAYLSCKADPSKIHELLAESLLDPSDKNLIEKHWKRIFPIPDKA